MDPSRSSAARAGRLLLGHDKPLRVRTSMTPIAMVVFVLFAFVQHFEVMLGLIDLVESNRLTAFNLCGATVFYLLVRSGASVRLSSDPSLSLPQMVFAIASVIWSYAITGPARGAVIAIMILVLMFGMFRLPPRALAGLGFVLQAGTMAWRTQTLPQRYPLRHEIVHRPFGELAVDLAPTFSAGQVELREGESQGAAIDRADRALYRAKQGVRDRIEID